MRERAFDVPVPALRRLVLNSGTSLEASGFLFAAVMAMLEFGEPLPADQKQSIARVRTISRQRYEALLAECLQSGSLVVLPTGEISSPILSDIRLARQQREPRTAIPTSVRRAVIEKTSGKCAYCAVVLTVDGGHPNSYQPDHVLPVAKGGSDDIANLIPSCASCNAKKSARTALQFMGATNDC